LAEAGEIFGWVLHAYVLMRNHFHLALETPQPNLVDGMHWVQSTYATRFNRFRRESGHLFQGRYQSLLIEDTAALLRVVDYIHLNPVRAKLVSPEQVATFRWSSLARFRRGSCPAWLSASRWLEQLGLRDDANGWLQYVERLRNQAAATRDRKRSRRALSRLGDWHLRLASGDRAGASASHAATWYCGPRGARSEARALGRCPRGRLARNGGNG
jgi:putative transposase